MKFVFVLENNIPTYDIVCGSVELVLKVGYTERDREKIDRITSPG